MVISTAWVPPLALGIALVAATPVFAAEAARKDDEAAEPLDVEHIFGFADGSDIGEAGEKEIESVTVGRFGRMIGSYHQLANETSFRDTLTDHLRLSFGTLTDYDGIAHVSDLPARKAATFSGVTGELRINILNRQSAPFGMSLSFNPQWRQYDPDFGTRAQSVALPVSLLLDKALIGEKLFWGASAVFGPMFQHGAGGWAHEDAITVTSALSYRILDGVFAAGEIRHENTATGGIVDAHALYVGPSLYVKLRPDLSIKFAWAAQIPDIGARTLDLTTYDRNQFELHLSYSF